LSSYVRAVRGGRIVMAKKTITSPAANAIAALTSSAECRWPMGDTMSADFQFCRRPVSQHHESYCEFHARKSVQSKQPGAAPQAAVPERESA
jgi:hypothetical protein